MRMCHPCEKLGAQVPATRVVNGIPKCEACFAGVSPVPQVESPKEKEKKMSKTGIDWKEVDRRKAAGESVASISRVLGTTVGAIYGHYAYLKRKDESAVSAGPRRAGRPKKARAVSAPAKATRFDSLIRELTDERDKLNQAIEVLQGLK